MIFKIFSPENWQKWQFFGSFFAQTTTSSLQKFDHRKYCQQNANFFAENGKNCSK
jgi:Fe-S cluster biosynthesis and repair protein YggX